MPVPPPVEQPARTLLQLRRWRGRNLTGAAKHHMIVRIRPGHVERGYLETFRIDGDGSVIYPPGLIWKGINHKPWNAKWVADGPWRELPAVESEQHTRGFDQNGSSTCTVVMDSIAFDETEGIAGLYHVIDRGAFSPLRGVHTNNRPHAQAKGNWTDVLNAAHQIEVWEGYGTLDEVTLLAEKDVDSNSYAPTSGALSRTWTGIVEDCELESHPDKITLTCRDFGLLLTDQRLAGNNIPHEIRPPIVFADRRATQGEVPVSAPLSASSGTINDQGWVSDPQADSGAAPWLDLTLQNGYYTEVLVAPKWSGMTCYISIYADGDSMKDRAHSLPVGWVDLGLGSTPDGTPYVAVVENMAASPVYRWALGGHEWDLDTGSRIRFTFSNLPTPTGGASITGAVGPANVAGAFKVVAFRYRWNPVLFPGSGGQMNYARHWILLHDMAEMAVQIFIWAGFKEWHVDYFGWGMVHPIVYGTDKFYIDVLKDLLQQADYVFYMDAPTNNDDSIGVPRLVKQTTVFTDRGYLEVKDSDMLEAMNPKWDLSELPYVIRFRGAVAKGGQALWQDTAQRYMATYYPPWSGQDYVPQGTEQVISRGPRVRRTAGILRHFSQTLGFTTILALYSNEECLFACVLAAIQYALGMATAQLQLPGLPGFSLNQVLGVTERPTGADTRIWIASITSKHTLGPQGSWHMTIGGALLDTEDMGALVKDYKHAWAANQRNKMAGIGA